MKRTLELASRPAVVKRALAFAVVVGTVLIAINHGDAILAGEMTWGRVVRLGLTALLPYLVSTLSSVAALKEARTPPAAPPRNWAVAGWHSRKTPPTFMWRRCSSRLGFDFTGSFSHDLDGGAYLREHQPGAKRLHNSLLPSLVGG